MLCPFAEVSTLRQRFTAIQATLCSFFERNLTPAHVDNTSDDDQVELVQVASTAMAPPHVQDQQEFYKMLVKTMQKTQNAPLQNQKIIVKSCDHEETLSSAKLQNSMIWLMYVTTDNVDWEDGTIKSVSLATFTQECRNILKKFSVVSKRPNLLTYSRQVSPLNPKMMRKTTVVLSKGSCCVMSSPPSSPKVTSMPCSRGIILNLQPSLNPLQSTLSTMHLNTTKL